MGYYYIVIPIASQWCNTVCNGLFVPLYYSSLRLPHYRHHMRTANLYITYARYAVARIFRFGARVAAMQCNCTKRKVFPRAVASSIDTIFLALTKRAYCRAVNSIMGGNVT